MQNASVQINDFLLFGAIFSVGCKYLSTLFLLDTQHNDLIFL